MLILCKYTDFQFPNSSVNRFQYTGTVGNVNLIVKDCQTANELSGHHKQTEKKYCLCLIKRSRDD